jgi:hypothetical protein
MPIHQSLTWPPSRTATLLVILGLAIVITWFIVELAIVLLGSSAGPRPEQLLAPFRWQGALAVA